MIQTVEAVDSMSLSKGNRIWLVVEAKLCEAIHVQTFITIPGPFHYRHALFYTIPKLIFRR